MYGDSEYSSNALFRAFSNFSFEFLSRRKLSGHHSLNMRVQKSRNRNRNTFGFCFTGKFRHMNSPRASLHPYIYTYILYIRLAYTY